MVSWNALIFGIVLCVAWAISSRGRESRLRRAPGLVGSWGFEYFGTSLTVRGAMHASVPARDSHISYISGYLFETEPNSTNCGKQTLEWTCSCIMARRRA